MICPVCRQEVPDESAFCNHCGAHMPPKPAEPAAGPGSEPAPPTPLYKKILSTLMLIAILAGFIYISYVFVSNVDPNVTRFVIE